MFAYTMESHHRRHRKICSSPIPKDRRCITVSVHVIKSYHSWAKTDEIYEKNAKKTAVKTIITFVKKVTFYRHFFVCLFFFVC